MAIFLYCEIFASLYDHIDLRKTTNYENTYLQLLLHPESDDSAQLSQVPGLEICVFL